MRVSQFEIKNFKGIKHLVLDLDDDPRSPVYVLVGLNESGKTTILEALSFFSENLGMRDEVTLHKGVVDDVHSLIPKARKDNFSESVILTLEVRLDTGDVSAIKKALAASNVNLTKFPQKISVTQEYEFDNSKFEKKKTTWGAGGFKARDVGKRYDRSLSEEEMAFAWKAVRTRTPLIIYYPNFLFAFPDRIYLDEAPGETKEQAFYRRVLQDVLDSLDNKLDLQTHIAARAKSGTPPELDALESVLNKVSAQITKTVFSPDLSVFKMDNVPRSIVVTAPKVDPSNQRLYLEVKLKEGDDSFYIRERSLGFQWFFTFLLFTQFRTQRLDPGRELTFLLDEPASNLHQTAQQRLVRALKELTKSQRITVVYSTHSHHLIEPAWLASTFVVRNRGLDYDQDDSFSSRNTDIFAERYRKFVASHPQLTTYYQPILDLLEYRPSDLEGVPAAAMIEGKTDYYLIRYFAEVVLGRFADVPFVPGCGAGGLDTVIQLYVAWGRHFVILLDSDTEGKKQLARYTEKFGVVVKNRVFTLASVNPDWDGRSIENVLAPDDALAIQRSVFDSSDNFQKKQFHLAVQETLLLRRHIAVGTSSQEAFERILTFLQTRLETVPKR